MSISYSSGDARHVDAGPFPAVAELVAHEPPMRLVDEIVEERSGGLVCETTIGDDFVFLRNGRPPRSSASSSSRER